MRANVEALRAVSAPADLCAVVKADGYGHGAVQVARAAMAGGASWLAVAIADEGAALREGGIVGPILVLNEPDPDELEVVVAHRLRPAVYSAAGVVATADAVADAGADPLPVHLKVDTGMHRGGAAVEDAVALAEAVLVRQELVLEGVWTHCAVADEPGNPFTAVQAARFEAALADLDRAGIHPAVVHAANSAAAIDHPGLRHDLVRCGIAVYGLDPSPALGGRVVLRPAMALKARVRSVRVVPAGDAVSYGQRYRVEVDTVVATVPLGYADGVPRRLGEVGGEVLLGGRRRRIAGTVTMDQLLVDAGPAGSRDADLVTVGDEVVLLGSQGSEGIGADEWAEHLGTVGYEIVCGISPRVPRRY